MSLKANFHECMAWCAARIEATHLPVWDVWPTHQATQEAAQAPGGAMPPDHSPHTPCTACAQPTQLKHPRNLPQNSRQEVPNIKQKVI